MADQFIKTIAQEIQTLDNNVFGYATGCDAHMYNYIELNRVQIIELFFEYKANTLSVVEEVNVLHNYALALNEIRTNMGGRINKAESKFKDLVWECLAAPNVRLIGFEITSPDGTFHEKYLLISEDMKTFYGMCAKYQSLTI